MGNIKRVRPKKYMGAASEKEVRELRARKPVHIPNMPMPDAEGTTPVRPEHNFTGTLDEWEERVFRNATHFNVYKRLGRGNSESKELKTFPEAVEFAKRDPLFLVYAVTASERFFCVERKNWDKYLTVWYEMHPVKL